MNYTSIKLLFLKIKVNRKDSVERVKQVKRPKGINDSVSEAGVQSRGGRSRPGREDRNSVSPEGGDSARVGDPKIWV